MKVIYNRIGEVFLTIEESRNIIFEIDRSQKDVEWSDYSSLDIDDLCDRLNHEDIYGCGTCYYVVDEDISRADLLNVIYG